MTIGKNLNSWFWRIGLTTLLVGILTVWGLAHVFQNSKQRQMHQAERELQIINRLQGQSVGAWRERRMIDAAGLSDDIGLGQTAAAWLQAESDGVVNGQSSRPDPHMGEQDWRAGYQSLQEQLQNELRVWQELKNYTAVYLLDIEGRIRLTPNGRVDQALPLAEGIALRQAFARAQTAVVEPRRADVFGFPFFSLLAPLYQGNQLVGAIWLVMDVRASLFPLLENWPSGSSTAESTIMMRDGDDAVILSPLRHKADSSLPYRVPLTRSSDPAVQAVTGMRGVFYSHDYRDEPVIAVASTVPGAPWYLVSKVDSSEVLSNKWREMLTMGLSVVFVLLCAGVILVFLQQQAWRRERKLSLTLERTLHWLEKAQETAAVGYFSYSLDTGIFSVSPITSSIFGVQADSQMSLERWLSSVHPLDRQHVADAYKRAVDLHEPLRLQHRIQRESDGQERWVETWGEYETDARSKHSVRLIGTFQDITERKLIEKELQTAKVALEAQVRRDALTQLANRLALDERLPAEWNRATRESTPLALLMIDVDHFKHFNDCYGHVAGDHCLQRIASVISSVVMRSTDLVARYGGEEFVVLLPATSEDHAVRLAEQICTAIRTEAIEHRDIDHAEIVTVSIGVVCVYPGLGEPVGAGVRTLLERADTALYMAKKTGRDRVVVYSNDMSGTTLALNASMLTPVD